MQPGKWCRLSGEVCLATYLASTLFSSAFAYVWPNPLLDELDSQLYDRKGYNSRALSAGMSQNCTFFVGAGGPVAGRANVADWVRTAYHDMATYNIVDGSGGLDASIRLEQDRAENAGDGFNNTLRFISSSSNRYFSLSDNIAMAAVTAIEMCGGPKIAYRGGRVDATEANTPGVPQPQESLDEHVASFARQGFTPEEMIGLVACGHTYGGVQNVAFPDIVDPSTNPLDTSGNVHFDSTFVQFDNNVVTEYLAGNTTNPLVVGHNVTTRSDFRIFNSDANTTMFKFANASVFRSTCADLYARMIDTVPKGVTLTEVLQPLDIKPVAFQLRWAGNGNVLFIGEARLWNTQENTQRQVKVLWKDRDGNSSPDYSAVMTHVTSHSSTPLVPDSPSITNLWYDIPNVLLNSTQSLSNFWFEVDEGGGNTRVVDQGGIGYAVQDVLMISNSTCMTSSGGLHISLSFAIRADIQPSRVYLKADNLDSLGSPFLTTTDIPLSSGPSSTVAGYNLWTAPIPFPQPHAWTLAVDANGQTYESTYIASGTSLTLGLVNLPGCQ